MKANKQTKAHFCKTINAMATAHTRWLFSSWKLGSVLSCIQDFDQSACFKMSEQTKTKQKKKQRISSLSTLKHQHWTWMHLSFFRYCGKEKSLAPCWFYCHCITFSATLLIGEGLAFCSESCCSFVLQVRNMGADFLRQSRPASE